MALPGFVLDEDLRGLLWRYIVRYNARKVDPIDIVRVGDVEGLPLGILDPDILIWCEANNRILVSHDSSTTPVHLAGHLAVGRHCPGIFLVRGVHPMDAITFLAAATYASEPSEWQDRYFYIP
jgi:hypothetical protein